MGDALRVETPLAQMMSRVPEPARIGLSQRCDRIIRAIVDERPEVGSEAELRHIAKFAHFSMELMQHLGDGAGNLLQSDVADQIDLLLMQEYESADTIVRLAYRHLSSSLEVYGELLASLPRGPELVDLMVSDLGALDADAIYEGLAKEPLSRVSNSMMLSICAALEVRNAEPSEMAYWAKRAVACSRQVRPQLHRLAEELRGLATRHRARHALEQWDDEEIENESLGWKKLLGRLA